ncbi:MAG: hypothetical protein WDZ28_01830 [Simkaniaceae bacterium]
MANKINKENSGIIRDIGQGAFPDAASLTSDILGLRNVGSIIALAKNTSLPSSFLALDGHALVNGFNGIVGLTNTYFNGRTAIELNDYPELIKAGLFGTAMGLKLITSIIMICFDAVLIGFLFAKAHLAPIASTIIGSLQGALSGVLSLSLTLYMSTKLCVKAFELGKYLYATHGQSDVEKVDYFLDHFKLTDDEKKLSEKDQAKALAKKQLRLKKTVGPEAYARIKQDHESGYLPDYQALLSDLKRDFAIDTFFMTIGLAAAILGAVAAFGGIAITGGTFLYVILAIGLLSTAGWLLSDGYDLVMGLRHGDRTAKHEKLALFITSLILGPIAMIALIGLIVTGGYLFIATTVFIGLGWILVLAGALLSIAIRNYRAENKE